MTESNDSAAVTAAEQERHQAPARMLAAAKPYTEPDSIPSGQLTSTRSNQAANQHIERRRVRPVRSHGSYSPPIPSRVSVVRGAVLWVDQQSAARPGC